MKWELVGNIGVDAGLVMVGDPCYTQGADATAAVSSWDEWLDLTFRGDALQSVVPVLGDETLGIAVQSGFGDGRYPVYVRRDEDSGRVAELRVVFIPHPAS